MKPFKIEATETTPLIEYNDMTNTFCVIGISSPKDANSFWKPVLRWVREFSQSEIYGTTIVINLDSFSISSTSPLYKTLKRFESVDGALVCWYYDHKDIEEIGKELESILNLEFEFILKNRENYFGD